MSDIGIMSPAVAAARWSTLAEPAGADVVFFLALKILSNVSVVRSRPDCYHTAYQVTAPDRLQQRRGLWTKGESLDSTRPLPIRIPY